MPYISRGADGSLRCAIKAIPGASRTIVQGERADELVVKIAAAPEKGKANAELFSFLAKSSGCPKSSFRLISGEHSQHKLIELPPAAAAFLESLGGGRFPA